MWIGVVGEFFCRSMIVVCIPRVLRVRAFRLWCLKMGFVGSNIGGSVMRGLTLVGCLGTWEWVGAGVSRGAGMEGFVIVSSIWGWGMVVSAVRLKPCVVGDGFLALHWKMLSWLEFDRCVRILRVLRWVWVVREVSGGCMMGSLRVGDIWCVVGGLLCGMVAL